MKRIPLAREGWPFVAVPAALAAGLFVSRRRRLALPFAAATLASLGFFRDPERRVPVMAGAGLWPAHGRVTGGVHDLRVGVGPAVRCAAGARRSRGGRGSRPGRRDGGGGAAMIPRRQGRGLRQRRWHELRDKRRRGVFLLPSLLTTGNLFCGFFALVLTLDQRYAEAALTIFVAMVIDLLDGRVARLMRATSQFGVEYDSLADIVSFCVRSEEHTSEL